MSTVQSGAYQEGFRAGLEAAAKVADEWGSGRYQVQPNGRVRFSVYDMQATCNTTGRGIAEDIRALSPEQLDRHCVDQAQIES